MPLTEAAIISLAIACAPGLDPTIIVGIARHESGLDPMRISPPNPNGSRDYGLMQINDRNFRWLGLTEQTALDPCQSIAAAAHLLTSYSRYNTGSPTVGLRNGYVEAVLAQTDRVKRLTGASVAEAGRAGGQSLSAQISTFSSR
jgi:type IV secretion system protein VirB1